MKKKLTINSVALGNLKQRRKQYTVMIIGIVLAMVFSSSVIFMFSAMNNSVTEMRYERFGKQSVIWTNITDNDIEKAKENKVLGKSGYAHILGSLSGTNKDFVDTASVAYLDDTALDLANPNLIEGRMPEAENEIAVEKMMLSKLGITANVGDEVTFNFKTQNGEDTLDNSHEVTYKLVGILKNKVSNIYFRGGIDTKYIPSAFVYKNASIEPGGKENLVCYAKFYSGKETLLDEVKMSKYLESIGDKFSYNFQSFSNRDVNYINDSTASDAQQQIAFVIILIAVLMVASCLVIVNSFNSNLEERKKQIGMYRAIGATKKQIKNIYAREALIISLISAPVSCLLSILIVKIIIKFMGEGFVFKLNWWAVLLSLIFCIACVMLSALIPLRSASRITPMQSIRNIESMRKLSRKRIKSKKEFNVPRLIASRSLTFGKGKQAAVSVILAIAIIGSGYAFSIYSYSSKNLVSVANDYSLSILTSGGDWVVNYKADNKGYTEYDRQFIENNKYIGESYGVKICAAQMLVPIGDSAYRKFYSPFYSLDIDKLYNSRINGTDLQEPFKSDFDQADIKKVQEMLNVNEFISPGITSYDAKYLESLKQYVYDGEINIDKINSGEEIILLAPRKVGMFITDFYGNGYGYSAYHNEEVDTKECDFKAECDFHAGDEIEIAVLSADSPIERKEYDPNVSNIPDDVKIIRKKVKIGALLSEAPYYREFRFITSTSAMNSLIPNLKYDELSFNLSTACADEVDKSVTEDIQEVASNVQDSHFISNYGFAQRQREDADKALIVMMSVVILLFVISISIINNTITANIRNSRTKIGTLRAVGADEKTLVKSYIYQLLSMLLWGTGIGLGGFFGSFGIAYLLNLAKHANEIENHPLEMILNPTAAIIFIILAFLICSVNLWLKIRKEMKNSIVENIREL